jgi:hypothetical protein
MKKEKRVYKQIEGLFECPYCKGLFNKLGINSHVWKAHEGGRKEKKERIKLGRVKVGCASSLEKEIERKRKISETMKKNPNAGGLRQGSGRGKKCWYESKIAGRVFLDSTWELAYAKWLDENNINWKRNWIKFPYEKENKIKYYIPDFYLIDSDEYIEIKGFERPEDKLKWSMFPYKLKILKYEELTKLGIKVIK